MCCKKTLFNQGREREGNAGGNGGENEVGGGGKGREGGGRDVGPFQGDKARFDLDERSKASCKSDR